MQDFDRRLLNLLKTDDRLLDRNGHFLQKSAIDKAWKMDHKLIGLLLQDPQSKAKFFDKVSDALIFNINTFIDYISDKYFLSNSYTRFRNKIGLNLSDKPFKETKDISLVWPYKDCVLEGGQTQEDKKNQREIFFNEIIAEDEINRFFDPKVLTHWKRHTSSDTEKVKDIKRDENGIIKENFIIKGNNLSVLHTLKNQFHSKVKLIYIDPPYNTGSDSFKYNDNFSHANWLTFMKNRLEVSKKLLKENGVIFVQCDDNEQAYLNVLMDEIFGKANFLNTISVKTKVSAGASGGGEDKKLKKNIEYIHCYCNSSFVDFKDVFKETEITKYIKNMKINNKSFKYIDVLISEGKKTHFKTIKDGRGENIEIYRHSGVQIKTVSKIEKEENVETHQAYKKYFDKIFTTTNAQSSIRERVWNATGKENDFYSIKYKPKSGKNKGKIVTQYYKGRKKVLVIWFRDTAFIDKKGNVIKKEKYGTFWDGINYNNLNKEGGVVFSSGKKPEQLLKRIIEMSTQPGDLVLDYHLGSGTTAAVAHKMGRQYIGIEQLDYGQNDSIVRIENVIKGDSSGISKTVEWKGGGDFISCELMKYNAIYIDKIQEAKSSDELLELWQDISENSFLNWYVNHKRPKEAINDFIQIGKEQGIEAQKKLLMELLNKNQLYVHLSEIADEDFQVSQEDQRLNKDFFQIKDNTEDEDDENNED